MKEFSYKGPVMEFDTCAVEKFEATTYAMSENKARANFAYQYKKKYGLMPYAKVTLPGKIVERNTYGGV